MLFKVSEITEEVVVAVVVMVVVVVVLVAVVVVVVIVVIPIVVVGDVLVVVSVDVVAVVIAVVKFVVLNVSDEPADKAAVTLRSTCRTVNITNFVLIFFCRQQIYRLPLGPSLNSFMPSNIEFFSEWSKTWSPHSEHLPAMSRITYFFNRGNFCKSKFFCENYTVSQKNLHP